MMVARASIALAVLSASLLSGVPVIGAAATVPSLALVQVAPMGGLTAFAARAGDRSVYVAEQAGRVHAVRNGRVLDRVVVDLSADVSTGFEQGLLGLAFSPDGSKLYAHYTDVEGDTRVDEFTMQGRRVDPVSRRNVLAVEQPQANHNGGQLAFGPDGHLYVGLGDGGGSGDEGRGHARGGNAQSLGTLLGKILRIDPTPSASAAYTVPPDNPFVGVPDARPEIWAYGLRNPWRFSFDARTGDLWIGDVGQDQFEEIDFAPALNGRDAGKGANFGWNRLEGDAPFRGDAPADAVGPVVTHARDDGWRSVIGGYVYRGRAIAALRGTYLYSDHYAGAIAGLRRAGDRFVPVDLGLEASGVTGFGQGTDGELYVLSQSDGLLRLQRA